MQKLQNDFRCVGIFAQINIVKALRPRNCSSEPRRGLPNCKTRLSQGPEIDPLWRSRGQGFDLTGRQLRKIVSGWSVNGEERLAGNNCDTDMAGWTVPPGNVFGFDAESVNLAESSSTPFVAADCTDEK